MPRLTSMQWLSRLQTYANASPTTSTSQQCTRPSSVGSSSNVTKANRQAQCPIICHLHDSYTLPLNT